MKKIKLKLSIADSCDKIKKSVEDEQLVEMIVEGGYENGDKIIIETDTVPAFYEIKLDETIAAAHVLLTEKRWEYTIDFSKRKKALHPNAFDESVHYLYVKSSQPRTLLSENPLDQMQHYGMYPHVSANAQTRNESAFACTNVIDGLRANTHHGKWPFTSWGIAGRKDARLKLEFGRMVEIEKIVFYLRAQFPHDSWWKEAKISFNGSDERKIEFEKTKLPQEFSMNGKKASYLEFYELIKAEDESEFPSLSLIEVIGKEVNE